MPRNPNRRRRSKGDRRTDSTLALLIPVTFIVIAVVQEIKDGSIDKYVIAVLLVFGLASAGWRIDSFFETYMRARYGQQYEDEENKKETEKKEIEKKATEKDEGEKDAEDE